MSADEKVKVWGRLGATITVGKQEFARDPEGAVLDAIKRGQYVLDGDSYVVNERSEVVVEFDLEEDD